MQQPLYRLTFDATSLLRDHPPRFQHPHKSALFDLAYPAGSTPAGTIEVTRWAGRVDEPISLPASTGVQVRPDFFDYRPVEGSVRAVEWHVNFADPRLFAAYGSRLFAQDEMQVAEHPLLGSVREALLARGVAAKTGDETGPTPVLVKNVERRIEVSTAATADRPGGLYGNLFADAPFDSVRRATRRIDPPTMTNFIAIAAPSGGHGDYTERQIESIFTNACTAFTAARQESGAGALVVIHTGFWGCGAFGGNRKLMIALQALAARAARTDHLVLHCGDVPGAADARAGLDVADRLASRCGTSCSVDTLVGRAAMLGLRWGFSDGN